MADGLPIPKRDVVLPQPGGVVGVGAYSNAQQWINIAQQVREAGGAEAQQLREAGTAEARAIAAEGDAARQIGQAEAQAYGAEAQLGDRIGATAAAMSGHVNELARAEIRQAQVAKIAEFEVDWRAKRNTARDDYTNDPDGFKKWADENMAAVIGETPAWMRPHAKQFLSREFEAAHNAIRSERRAEDKRLETQALTSRIKLADEDVMAIASATGNLGTPEGKAAVATHAAILESAVATRHIAPEQAQLLGEDLTTRAEGAVVRKSVEQAYRMQGFEAARAHLDEQLQAFGAPFKITDRVRQQTLGWLRSEEAGLRGERDAVGKEWAEAKKNIAVLGPDVLLDIQQRAYSVGAIKTADDIQAHVTALNVIKSVRQLPAGDQMRILATGNLESRLTQRESAGDPTRVNEFGYAGAYQFGAPRLATLGIYKPGESENLQAWSKTPANAPGKWSGSFNIPGFPAVKTLEQFKASPGAQKAAYEVHQQRTEQEIEQRGLSRYEGQTVGGVPITRDGLRAMVHLAGADGTQRVLNSGGSYNPPDANGTTPLDYARLGNPGATPGDLTGTRGGLLAMGILRKELAADLGGKIGVMQTAIGKTEFPPMDEIGALVAQAGLVGTEEQKRQVAEMAAQAEYGAKFVTLPQAQRDEIVGVWKERLKTGATQYQRKLADTVIAADRRVTEEWKRDPYEAASRFMEGVPALPAIDWGSPTAPQVLAAKVSIQNTFRADQGMEAVSVLRAGEAQQLASLLVNGDPAQGSAIVRKLHDNLPADMYKATISSAPIRAALDGMVRSYDPDRLNTAMSVLDKAYRDDPIGFKDTFKDDTLRRLQTWQARKEYTSPIAMAAHFQRTDDPAFATARKALETEADNKLSGITPAKVANELGSVADRWVPFVNQAPPVDPIAAQALAGEYTQIFKERYVDTQNEDKAKEQAVERLRTVWGPSTANSNALMKHPPERYYPQVDGSHDWLKRDLEAAIVASRFGEEGAPGRDPLLFGRAYSYKLLSDPRTEADVAAKRPPSYVVVVTDAATGRDTIPLDFEGKPTRFRFDPSTAIAATRDEFLTRRERTLAPASLDLQAP